MKLTNQQIDALVAQEHEKFNTTNVVKEVKPSKPQLNLAKKLQNLVATIPKEIVAQMPYAYLKDCTEATFLRAILKVDNIVKPVAAFDKVKFRNKILIASIDANDLKELQEKLK
jgi:hypothetical protein